MRGRRDRETRADFLECDSLFSYSTRNVRKAGKCVSHVGQIEKC